ncbi:HNH homing endonuclease [Pectobacterium phage PP90]|uniref:HNH homing endonuclease n=1 Tax=Pectobacterium phage PP90 TaxID=1873959 RepID=A0A1B1PEI1_9CAUD|nr:HNH homing endonuclease [Pectobacterium phage PP90]
MSCTDHGRHKSLSKEGYLLVKDPRKKSRCTSLHRMVYACKMGTNLDGIADVVVRHTCDNPRCINPEHLIGGTKADNNRDRAERGRSARVVPSRQRLSQEDVQFIRLNWVKRHPLFGTTKLAARFGVDSAVIIRVIKGTYVCTR